MRCPLCGGRFDEQALACHAACPMASIQGCRLVCCPHCGYQMVDEQKSGLARFMRQALRLIQIDPAGKEPPQP